MEKVKVSNKKPANIDRKKLIELRKKLGTNVYVGDATDRVKAQRDSAELEVKKLKIEVKKK